MYYLFEVWHFNFILALILSAAAISLIGLFFQRYLYKPWSTICSTLWSSQGCCIAMKSASWIIFGPLSVRLLPFFREWFASSARLSPWRGLQLPWSVWLNNRPLYFSLQNEDGKSLGLWSKIAKRQQSLELALTAFTLLFSLWVAFWRPLLALWWGWFLPLTQKWEMILF